MTPPVVAIGLDAADPVLVERWMDAGHLPHLQRARERGAYARLTTLEYCRAESSCTTFLTGCSPARHGYWSPFRLDPKNYTARQQPYVFDRFPPFYALGPDFRVCVFDMPQTTMSDAVNGVQVLGWGGHSPRTPSHSRPEPLFGEIVAQYGTHPTLRNDDVPTIGDRAAVWRLKENLQAGVTRRAAIVADLLRRDRWDLFLTYVSETHSAQHYLWHLSQPDHPLYDAFHEDDSDPLLDVFTTIDAALGQMLAAAPDDARVVMFSDHGMESNSTDLPSMVFLPEVLYRHAFPGRRGLADTSGQALPPMRMPSTRRSWRSTVWADRHDANPVTRWLRHRLPSEFFHYAIERRFGINGVPLCPDDCPIGSQPPMWYHPAWAQMPAFALPSFSEGYVRINVKGREGTGLVEPSAFLDTCARVTGQLHQLRNPRNGRPLVEKVVRMRDRADDSDPGKPDADLIVLWDSAPADVVEAPEIGRIGPLPYRRSGSHVHRGFLMAAGPGIDPAIRLPEGQAIDIAPTILTLIGAPIPAHFDGTPLVADAVAAPRRSA